MTTSAFRTILLGPPPSIYGVPTARLPLQWPQHDAGERLDYTLDATPLLSDVGDAFSYATLAISPYGPGELTCAAFTVDGGKLIVWLQGGMPGRIYHVRVTAQTPGTGDLMGRVFSWTVRLRVDPGFAWGVLPPPLSPNYGPLSIWTLGSNNPPADTDGDLELENGTGGFLLESAAGLLILESSTGVITAQGHATLEDGSGALLFEDGSYWTLES